MRKEDHTTGTAFEEEDGSQNRRRGNPFITQILQRSKDKAMKKSKRILSLLLGLVMFLTLTPMVSALDTDALQTRKLDRNGFEAFELLGEMKQLDVDRLGDMKLQGKNLMVDGEIRKPGAKSEEEQYIEDVAESLGKPVGAVDIVDTAGVSTYIVWMHHCPNSLV